MNPLMRTTTFNDGALSYTNNKRSRFSLNHNVKLTCNSGDLVPLDFFEVIPGDSIDMNLSYLMRLQTLAVPLMDNVYFETFSFYIPNRILWDNWEKFLGSNDDTKWSPTGTYSIPKINLAGVSKTSLSKSILDYLGIPCIDYPTIGSGGNADAMKISSLPVRAYCQIWNYFFRDENLQDPILVNTDDSGYSFDFNKPYTGGRLLPANKPHDYFTSCLPDAQKGPAVQIPLGSIARVYANGSYIAKHGDTRGTDPSQYKSYQKGNIEFMNNDATGNLNAYIKEGQSYTLKGSVGPSASGTGYNLYPSNLYADLSEATGINVNQFRQVLVTQHLYEALAAGGSRYNSLLHTLYGVNPSNDVIDRPELIGYSKNNITVHQVVQNSQTDETPLGTTAAFSLSTEAKQGQFSKSFTENGIVMTVGAIRWKPSYQQGTQRYWFKDSIFDFWSPLFAGLGNTPVYNREIYTQGTSKDLEVFGYQESFSDYRYIPDRVAGEMRSSYAQSLDIWHLGDNYQSLPVLSSDWIKQDKSTLDRALQVQSTESDQVLLDLYFEMQRTSTLELYSIPGIDKV